MEYQRAILLFLILYKEMLPNNSDSLDLQKITAILYVYGECPKQGMYNYTLLQVNTFIICPI